MGYDEDPSTLDNTRVREIPDSWIDIDLENEELETGRTARRRIKQRKRRQAWRKSNRAGDDSAQSRPTSPAAATSLEVDADTCSSCDDEDDSDPVQEKKRHRPSPRERNERFFAEFRIADTRLANWELAGRSPDIGPYDVWQPEVLELVSTTIRRLSMERAPPELNSSHDIEKLDACVTRRAKELAFYQKKLLAATSLTSKYSVETARNGLAPICDAVTAVNYGHAVLKSAIPQLESRYQMLKQHMKSMETRHTAAD